MLIGKLLHIETSCLSVACVPLALSQSVCFELSLASASQWDALARDSMG